MARSTVLRDLVHAQQVHLVDNVMANDRIAREFGLGLVDLQTLHLLVLHPQVRTAGGIADAAGFPTSTVTGIVDRLVRAGFVSRVRDEQDRRRVILRLTDRVAEIQERYAASELSEHVATVAASFTDKELRIVLRWFTTLHAGAD